MFNIAPHTYILLLTKYYDPHDYIIRRHRRVNRLVKRMLANGYSPLLIVTCCNTARHTHGLELLPAPTGATQTNRRKKAMSNRVTQRELESLVDWLNKITNQPAKPYADGKSQIGNYHLSYAYGGVNLHQIVSDGGGVTTPLGGGYWTKRDLAAKIRAFIAGIELTRQ